MLTRCQEENKSMDEPSKIRAVNNFTIVPHIGNRVSVSQLCDYLINGIEEMGMLMGVQLFNLSIIVFHKPDLCIKLIFDLIKAYKVKAEAQIEKGKRMEVTISVHK